MMVGAAAALLAYMAVGTRSLTLSSMLMALIGVLVLVPTILWYTAFSYYVFRGKVRGDEGYH